MHALAQASRSSEWRSPLAVPVDIAYSPDRTVGEVQSFTVRGRTSKDTVCETSPVAFRWDYPSERYPVTGHDKNGQKGRMTNEQITLYIQSETIWPGDPK